MCKLDCHWILWFQTKLSKSLQTRHAFNTWRSKFLVGACSEVSWANLPGNELSMTPQHNSAPERGLDTLVIGRAQCTVVQLHWLLAHLQALFSTSWITWLDVVDDKTAGWQEKSFFSQFEIFQQKSLSPPPDQPSNAGAADTGALKSW